MRMRMMMRMMMMMMMIAAKQLRRLYTFCGQELELMLIVSVNITRQLLSATGRYSSTSVKHKKLDIIRKSLTCFFSFVN